MMSRADNLTLAAPPILIRYRYCERCRREWPPETSHYPNCCLWLGETARERTDWQIVPTVGPSVGAGGRYDNVRTVAVAVRLTGGQPSAEALSRIGGVLMDVFAPFGADLVGVDSAGWLAWTVQSDRPAFLMARAFVERMKAALPPLQTMLSPGTRLHWGAWVDDCILRLGAPEGPRIADVPSRSLFDFEPGDRV